ncbi:hypothetical protein GF357_02045 [Candidatus Dojkabacteria bacterium]|nr:hypothetical protein [Candidatus Dojkabacteria bacterium]
MGSKISKKTKSTKNSKSIFLKKKNSDTESKKEFFIESVSKFCDRCGTPYSTSDVHIVQETSSSTIIHFSCSNCLSNHIANFVPAIGTVSRMPINTDLTSDEIVGFIRSGKVSTDDVLDVYDRLND